VPPIGQSKNSIRLDDEGFWSGGVFCKYEDIQHIFFARIREKQSVNFLPVGEANSAYLVLTLRDGRKISSHVDEAGFIIGLNKNKQDEIATVADACVFLSRRSFDQRLAHYVEQINARGYFEYDECKFYPAEQRIVFRSKSFPVAETRFRRGPAYILMERKGNPLLERVRRELTVTKSPQFVTATDRDVIFVLLERYFGLRWPS
jgi:hypothetical protein